MTQQTQTAAPATGVNAGQEQFIQTAMSDPSIMKQMHGKTPEQQAAFMRKLYQDYTGQEAMASEEMSQADALRNGAMPEGATAGNQYVAASPLSFLAKGMNDYQGNKNYQAAQQKKQQLSQDKTDGLSEYAAMKAGISLPDMLRGN